MPLRRKQVTLPSWAELFTLQKNEARSLYGSTSVNMPGRTDVQYPNLTGTQWLKLKKYWSWPLEKVEARVASGQRLEGIRVPSELVDYSASRVAWDREYRAYQSETGTINTILATGYGVSLLPASRAVAFWRTLEPLILRSKGIFETPYPYEMFIEELAKQAALVAGGITSALTPSIPTWLKLGAAAAGALYLMSYLKGRK